MSIVSFTFLAFLILFGIIYFLIPKKFQWIAILLGNLTFYAYSGIPFLIYLLSCTFFTWYAALRIEKESAELEARIAEISDREEKNRLRGNSRRRKRIWITIALALTLGVWIVLKYLTFFVDSLALLFGWNNLQGALKFIVPLGMSFYTFDAVGYLIDVYRSKYSADRSYFHYLTFVSYFPHIVQGPLSRYDTLGQTLYVKHSFSYDRMCLGLRRMLWGYFKKLIIADKLGIAVSEVFANYQNYWGMNIVFVILLYSIQIYADFSGYMDIVCGFSKILGIDLEENFRQPYFAKSVGEFWQRWHITLGHWFRDYLFYPISMSKRLQQISKKVRSRYGTRASRLTVNIIVSFWVWSATGLWHGAAWTFLIWGWLNMFVMILSQVLDPFYEKMRNLFHISPESRLWSLWRMVRTFGLTSFFRFFSRANSLDTANGMISRTFSAFNRKLLLHPMDLFPKMSSNEIVIALIGTLMLLIVDILVAAGKWDSVRLKTPFPVRDLVYIFMIFAIVLFAGSGGNITANFIYAHY